MPLYWLQTGTDLVGCPLTVYCVLYVSNGDRPTTWHFLKKWTRQPPALSPYVLIKWVMNLHIRATLTHSIATPGAITPPSPPKFIALHISTIYVHFAVFSFSYIIDAVYVVMALCYFKDSLNWLYWCRKVVTKVQYIFRFYKILLEKETRYINLFILEL